jgi:hypothetical protein
MSDTSELRLSAQRAFLGRVHSQMRLIKISKRNSEIVLVVLVESEPSEAVRSDVSEAATEIIADFPQANKITEEIEVSNSGFPHEDVLDAGWIYQ